MAPLSPERWRKLSPLLDHALDLDAAAREPWLARLRHENAELAADVESLLRDQEVLDRAGFLDGAIVSVQTPLSLAGTTVGSYTLVSPLGRGGMGSVWLAERSDGRFARKAAIKLLNAGLIGRTGEERFKHEGSLLARLTHPNIATLLDAGVTATGQPYLVLELVEGEHIDEYCRRRALPTQARLRLFLDVLEAVAHAHANLIVHRDIKPSNVLVRSDGVVKLLDFGIAKLLESDQERAPAFTAEGAGALTPEYAAPEQLTGGAITTATDVHALGVLLYVLLGAPHPAAGTSGSAAELIKAIVETDPPLLSSVAPDGRVFRGDLDNIIAKALKKRPAERYPSVTAFAEDLRRYLHHEPVSARPDTFVYRARKFARRRAGGLAAAAAMAAIVAALIGFYTVRLTSERDRSRLEAQKSAQVSELLTSLLTGADPYATRDREPTVRNILDAGAERVQKELASQPELKAEMLTVIGRVYQRLGLLDRAAPLLEEAAVLGRASGDSPHLGAALTELGLLAGRRDSPEAAIPILEEALTVRRRVLGDVHKDVAVTLVELGRAYEDTGRLERAIPLLREALAIRQQIFGEEHRETATSKSALALVLLQRGELEDAEPLLREALETTRRVLGEHHPNTGAGWNNLGLLLLDKSDYVSAEPMLRRALEIRQKEFGDTHSTLWPNLNNVAVAVREQGKLDEAEALLTQALAFTRDGQGSPDVAHARLLYNLAKVHLGRGDFTAAERTARDSLALHERVLPADDFRIAATKSVLAEALTGLREYEAAETLLVAASRALQDLPGRQGKEAAANRARLAALHAARNGR